MPFGQTQDTKEEKENTNRTRDPWETLLTFHRHKHT